VTGMGSRRPGCLSVIRWFASRWYGFTTGVGVAWSALFANKFRASMTALGIVIGVMTVTGILSIIHGLDQGVENQMSLMGARSLYVSQWPWAARRHWHKYRNRPPLTDWQYQRLRELVPFAEAMAPRERQHASVERAEEKINDVDILGTNSEFTRITGYTLERGRFFSPADVRYERPLVVLGSELSEQLFDREDPLGKSVVIQGMRYMVIGVLKSQGSFLGRSRDVTATIPIGRFRRSFGLRHSMDIAIKVDPGIDLEEAEAELTGIMRRVRGLRPTVDNNFSVNQQKTMVELYHDITGTLFMVIIIVGAISLVVGGIGIMNIMLVSVTERTREIGVRKALGARRRTVLFQFLIESLVLSGIGGLIGLTAGFLVAYIVDAISPLPAKVSLLATIAGLGFSAIVGVFFGIYPAWRASRLDPIVALRYE
jgi:putative ABC transport system permease protein